MSQASDSKLVAGIPSEHALTLISAYGDASFECGSWRKGDDSTYSELLETTDVARKALHAYVAELETKVSASQAAVPVAPPPAMPSMDAFRIRAEAEFDAWDFGTDVIVEDFDGWDTRGRDDWRRTVFVRLADDSPDNDSRAVTFSVQFGMDGLVAEVSARLVVDGGIVGNRGTARD